MPTSCQKQSVFTGMPQIQVALVAGLCSIDSKPAQDGGWCFSQLAIIGTPLHAIH